MEYLFDFFVHYMERNGEDLLPKIHLLHKKESQIGLEWREGEW